MKRAVCLLALGLAIVGMGCSSMSINHDYDTSVDFRSYKTFDWIEQPTSPAGNAQQAQQRSDLLAKRIRNAVNSELGQKGMWRDTGNPDLLLVYHTGVQNKVNVTDWGYSYGRGYYGGYGSNIDVYSYDEGTLIVDLIDTKTKELVWRGSAKKALSSNPSPEEVDKTITTAVAAIFSKYPPK
jgi:hypothetical protein